MSFVANTQAWQERARGCQRLSERIVLVAWDLIVAMRVSGWWLCAWVAPANTNQLRYLDRVTSWCANHCESSFYPEHADHAARCIVA